METPEFPDVLTPRTPWPGLTEVFSRPPMFGTFVSLGLGINADLDRVAYNANINHLLQFITIIGEEMTVAELSELIGKAKDNPWAALSDMPESVNERLKEEVGLGHIVGGLWALKNTAVYEKVLAVINAKEQFDLHSIGTLIELYDQPGHQPVTYCKPWKGHWNKSARLLAFFITTVIWNFMNGYSNNGSGSKE